MTRFVTVTEDSTKADLAECIAHLRAKALSCQVAEIRAELDETVDELVAQWVRAEA